MTIKNILNAKEKIITVFKVSLELINFNPIPKKQGIVIKEKKEQIAVSEIDNAVLPFIVLLNNLT